MNLLLPIIASVFAAGSLTLDKIILSVRKTGYQTYVGLSFPLAFLISIFFLLIVQPPFSPNMFSGWQIPIFFGVTGLSIGFNLIFYHALKNDNLLEIQTVAMFRSIPVIIFTGILFADERNWIVTILALVASGAIIWSHWKNHHLEMTRRTWRFLLWEIFAAPLGAAGVKILLVTWHPIFLEMFRAAGVMFIFFFLYSKNVERVSFRNWLLILTTNILSVVAGLIHLQSYRTLGVVYTTLVFSLSPLLTYFASIALLKEKLSTKKNIAFWIILMSILAARFIA